MDYTLDDVPLTAVLMFSGGGLQVVQLIGAPDDVEQWCPGVQSALEARYDAPDTDRQQMIDGYLAAEYLDIDHWSDPQHNLAFNLGAMSGWTSDESCTLIVSPADGP